MLQDTELWSVLEVSRYTGANLSPIALPHGRKRLCGGALGLLGCTILFTDRFTCQHARLKAHVSQMDGGLEARIHEAGESELYN